MKLVRSINEWKMFGKCLGEDGNIFYPNSAEDTAYDYARTFCRSCPVKEECREYAFATNQEYGMWGETTPEERRALRRQVRLRKLATK